MATKPLTQRPSAPMPLAHREARWVFAIDSAPGELADERRREILHAMRERRPTLVVAWGGGVGDRLSAIGALPGLSTLCADDYRPILDTALVSAAGVVTASPAVAAIARALGVDAIELDADTPAAEICAALEARRPRKRPATDSAKAKAKAPLHAAFVADEKYLPFFFAVVENLREVHGDALKLYLLSIGGDLAPAVRRAFPDLTVRIEPFEAAVSVEEARRFADAPMSYKAFSSKPRALARARRLWPKETVFLFDLDVFFYRSPIDLATELRGNDNLLVFPQWSDDPRWTVHGLFNSGVTMSAPGSEPILDWWSTLTLHRSDLAPAEGFYGDQRYLDQAIVNFTTVAIYRGMDQNVAAWNRRTLGVRRSTENPWRLETVRGPVGSFHAAGPDDDGFFEHKYLWDALCAFFQTPDPENPATPVLENTLEQQRGHWEALDRFLQYHEWRHRKGTAVPTPESATLRDAVGASATRYVLWERWLASYRGLRAQFGRPATTEPARAIDFWIPIQSRAAALLTAALKPRAKARS